MTTETGRAERGAAVAGGSVRRSGGVAGGDRPAPPVVTPDQADLIRWEHNRRGMSVKMIAAVMSMTQAQVRAVLDAPAHDPGQDSGSAGEPSEPTTPARRARRQASGEEAVKVPDPAPIPLRQPGLSGGRAARPSKPREPDVLPRPAVASTGVTAVRLAKAPDAASHATASGYVPIMSDFYRRRPA